MKAKRIINVDKQSCETHMNDITDKGIMIFNSDEQENESSIKIPLTSETEKYLMKN
ncbi:MAG: hypothetical protein JSV62_00520 [Promethearchaeota archaeon]|nr:MAG: hypothetical protein JSV62_00520 [Candidatus Lokiarchaeota archaeon]